MVGHSFDFSVPPNIFISDFKTYIQFFKFRKRGRPVRNGLAQKVPKDEGEGVLRASGGSKERDWGGAVWSLKVSIAHQTPGYSSCSLFPGSDASTSTTQVTPSA